MSAFRKKFSHAHVHISSELFVMSTGNKTLRGGRERDDDMVMMMMPLLRRWSRFDGVVSLAFRLEHTNADSNVLRFFLSNFLFRVLEKKRKTLNRDGDYLVWFLVGWPPHILAHR